MRLMSSARITASVLSSLGACAVMVAVVGACGVVGVRSANLAGEELARDELRTATATATLTHGVDVAYARALVVRSVDDPVLAARTRARLLDHDVPALDAGLVTFENLHADDAPAERATIAETIGRWQALRAVLIRTTPTTGPTTGGPQLTRLYDSVSGRLAELTAREDRDARADTQRASAVSDRIVRGIVLSVLAGLVLLVGVGFVGARKIRRAVEPAREQVEFSDSLQLAQDELEAHELLRRHLERTLAESAVTVLNRNNSADRLEAATDLPEVSELHRTLAH
jgi:hypothetical protein